MSREDKQKHQEIAQLLNEYEDQENSIKNVICTMQSANSEHAPLFFVDEVDVVSNPAAYEEAKNIPTNQGRQLSLTVLISTRKFMGGLVQREIDQASKSRLKIRHWNIIDVTERCPPERHRPDLPRLPIYRSDETLAAVEPGTWETLPVREKATYVRDEGFHGCINNCSLFAVCKGRLATHQTSTSLLLQPISETIQNPGSLKYCWIPIGWLTDGGLYVSGPMGAVRSMMRMTQGCLSRRGDPSSAAQPVCALFP